MQKPESRRSFLKKATVAGGLSLAAFPAANLWASHKESASVAIGGHWIKIKTNEYNTPFKPLDHVEIEFEKPGRLLVFDGKGTGYFDKQVTDKTIVQAGGALGTHMVILLGNDDEVLDTASFKTGAQTEILDKNREFEKMLKMLLFSIMGDRGVQAAYRMQGELYNTYAGWFQDHVHVMKAMKYFFPDVKTGIDLWARGQREDGMLADNCYQDLSSYKSWLNRFGDRFVWKMGDDKESSTYYIRIPVENMGEFTFLDAVYYSWKASGDDEWMARRIENCLKAIKYATTDEYRWSEKFQLLKRGYTIDIWDFQPLDDVKVWDGDIMMARPGVTNFGIMYGDNVGFYVGCEYVGEMLEYLGRNDEAAEIREIGRGIKKRLDDLSWNGEFYTHYIPEDPDVKRDFGDTDVDRQVTISSSYAINRRIGFDKAVSLIKTYQRIRKEMPASSSGEWYMCYPPFEKGWHNPKWEYMNGGVSSIVAGELAHGAFWHGFEAYGLDILRRISKTAYDYSGNRMKCIYRGAMPEKPVRNFTTLSLKNIANADTHGTVGAPGLPAFTGEGVNDMHNFPVGNQVFHDVPFSFVDPAANGRKACLIISGDAGYATQATLPVGKTGGSIYFVHAQSGGDYMGDIVLHYEDGTTHVDHVLRNKNIAGWWYPLGQRDTGVLKLAWEGTNGKSISIGAFIYGMDNPYKDKVIKSLEFKGVPEKIKWIVLGATLSEEPVFFMPSRVSYGAPDNWGAAALVYALLEGLAGMKDDGMAFNKATLAPRWDLAGVDEVKATLKYEASGGYISYRYQKVNNDLLRISFTGSGSHISVDILIPQGRSIRAISNNNALVTYFSTKEVENSRYAVLIVDKPGVNNLEVQMV